MLNKNKIVKLLGVLIISFTLLQPNARADVIEKQSIEDKLEEVMKSKYSDIDKVSSLLDLYDQQVEEQHSIQDYITTLKVEIDAKQAEITALEQKISNNNAKVQDLDVDIAQQQDTLKAKQEEIKATQLSIDKKQKELDALNEDLTAKKERVNNIYRVAQIENASGTNSILKVLLDAEGITDFINRGIGLTRMQSAANDLVRDLNAQLETQKQVKADIEATKVKLLEQELAITKVKQEIEQAKKLTQVNTNKQQETQQRIKEEQNQLDAKVKDSQQVIKDAEANAEAVEKHFETLTTELITYQESIQQMIAASSDPKHKEILSDVYKRIDAIKPVVVDSIGVGQTWSFDTKDLDLARKKLVEVAKTQLGVPYVWGGTAWDQGLDCSGLTMGIYERALGINIKRVTTQQETVGKVVSQADLKTGDLIFWGPIGGTTHVGMYIGEGVYIHAPQPGQNVTYSKYGIETASTIRRIIE